MELGVGMRLKFLYNNEFLLKLLWAFLCGTDLGQRTEVEVLQGSLVESYVNLLTVIVQFALFYLAMRKLIISKNVNVFPEILGRCVYLKYPYLI